MKGRREDMIILQAKTVAPQQVVESSSLWRAASGALISGEIQRIRIPTARATELPVISQYMRDLTGEQLQGLNDTNIVVNLHFNSHHETQVAVNALRDALPSSSVETGGSSITIAQGATGGAVIGSVGGVGVALLLQSLKSTTEAFGNPILSTLGSVLVGIAVGAVGGAAFAKTTEYSVSVGKTGVTLAAGTQNKPEKSKS